MNESNDWQDLSRQLRTFIIWILSGWMEGGFLIVSAITQSVVDLLIKIFHLSGFNSWLLDVFQILFAIFTLLSLMRYLISLVIDMYGDVHVRWLRVQRRIRQESKRRKRR